MRLFFSSRRRHTICSRDWSSDVCSSDLPDEALRGALKERVSRALGKSFAPREVRFVRDLPKTRNAKVMRRVIRPAWLGNDPGDISALENPGTVEEVRRAV